MRFVFFLFLTIYRIFHCLVPEKTHTHKKKKRTTQFLRTKQLCLADPDCQKSAPLLIGLVKQNYDFFFFSSIFLATKQGVENRKLEICWVIFICSLRFLNCYYSYLVILNDFFFFFRSVTLQMTPLIAPFLARFIFFFLLVSVPFPCR